jgi:kinesin family member 1
VSHFAIMSPSAAPASGGGGNIKVVVRVRPFNGREVDRNAQCIVEMKGNQTVLTPPAEITERLGPKGAKDHGQKVFAFDRSYWSFNRDDSNYAGQDNLHDDLGKPLLENAFQGYNNCIFAYGQTGSGKSYSMMGYGKEAGIIPKICQDMFTKIESMQADKNLRCTVEVSYLEIYNERVRDLLNPATKGNLKVREHPSTGPYVEDLAKLVVGSFNEIEHLMDEGNKARTVAATNMNETSSRSHAVFTLMLTQKRFDPETKMEMEKVAKISLVDLAGSERATSTGATGARLKEGAEINRSLSTLGRVIAALADLSTGKKKGGKATQVPYRDSVLTWLLKDSLGGNSMTAMIAAISPADINYDETLSTLRYADSAKRIKNHAVINEDANARMIRELKEELALLRSKLGEGGTAAGLGPGATMVPGESYPEGTPLDQQFVNIVQADGSTKKVSKAEIAEQLSQSEKLLSDLNQTWEEKLQKTEEIHKEREAALEELGISIEKGFIGLSTPKRMPHLVNLSDDPLLAECLVYNLKPGTTTVGNVDSNAENQANIRLNGSRILHDHCVFENAADGKVTVIPREGASVMVNGKKITEPTRLHSGYRVILGDFHIFRFNHPLEAKAERAEQGERQSLLRQSVTASQLAALGRTSPSPQPTPTFRPGHDRTLSRPESELGDVSRPDSPAPFQRGGRDSDWSLARREAAPALLGTDQNLAKLTDEELNALFEDVQKARAERVVNGRDGDEDLESMASYPIREKYMSTGTLDNFSLDTALTIPSTPKQGEVEDKLREVREEMQTQLDKQKEEYQDQLKTAEAANVEVEEIRKEKIRMEVALKTLKEEMQKQLEVQKRDFEEKIQRLDPIKRPKGNPKLSEVEKVLARKVVVHWKGRRYVRMAEDVLSHAATLKEAQILSHELGEDIVFQFTVVGVGHNLCSSYDMVLNGLSRDENDDPSLESTQKPCIGVRVIDYKHTVAHLWSLEKLQERVKQMRQMQQLQDEPDYAQQHIVANAFVEEAMPEFTLVGEADVPLRAVFDSRVQDFALDVLSPHTSHVIGIVKLSLEPSSARAPSNMLKFNVVMQEMLGFAEREGTDVHAQLFIPGISEEDGVTTTQMIKDFDEGPIRFESVHSMSVPTDASRDVILRVALFAKVSAMHLDKLLSWDDMRDAVPFSRSRVKPARLAESNFFTEEKYDLLARVQVLEMNENAEYVPVEVLQTSEVDAGTFQLHQGIQRRIAINLSHSSGDALPWDKVGTVTIGKIQLLDLTGKVLDQPGNAVTADLALKLSSEPQFRQNANGTRSITLFSQWDSSQHSSPLLDRVTADKYRVQLTLTWEIASARLAEPMRFTMPLNVQVVGRTFVRQTSMLAALWQSIRVVHSSTSIFTLSMRPAPIKRVGDLWRMSSQHDYVKGEENLTSWTPRGVSLVSDFIAARKKRRLAAEMGAVQGALKRIGLPETVGRPQGGVDGEESGDVSRVGSDGDADSIDELLRETPETSQQPVDKETPVQDTAEAETADAPAPTESEYSDYQQLLLSRCLSLWKRYPDPLLRILSSHNTSPPTNGVPSSHQDDTNETTTKTLTPPQPPQPTFITTIIPVPRNPTVLKGGYLLVPNSDATRWVKRFVELRRPYLHVHNVTNGDEVAIVSLRNARVDSQPGILGLWDGHEHAVDDSQPAENGAAVNGNSSGAEHKQVHRRTSSGRLISAIWTGTGGSVSSSLSHLGSNTSATARRSPLARLSDRLQAGVFAIYGTDNTWLFAARSERDKLDWLLKVDQSFLGGAGGIEGHGGSGRGSPAVRDGMGVGAYPEEVIEGDEGSGGSSLH